MTRFVQAFYQISDRKWSRGDIQNRLEILKNFILLLPGVFFGILAGFGINLASVWCGLGGLALPFWCHFMASGYRFGAISWHLCLAWYYPRVIPSETHRVASYYSVPKRIMLLLINKSPTFTPPPTFRYIERIPFFLHASFNKASRYSIKAHLPSTELQAAAIVLQLKNLRPFLPSLVWSESGHDFTLAVNQNRYVFQHDFTLAVGRNHYVFN